jgi:uncharacterized membrane protein YeaQ/YmgE (transglycosylase-associated protein family)
MGIIAWIVLGLAAGIIAKWLLGGRAKHGVIVTILIGVAGALLGGWVASALFGIDAVGDPHLDHRHPGFRCPAAALLRGQWRRPQAQLLARQPITGSPTRWRRRRALGRLTP